MRALIIEDDERLADLIVRVLRQEQIAADVVYDGDAGLEFALSGAYQVAIIDWMLPRRDGLSVCQAIRAAGMPVAILMVTARALVADRVQGLDSGADDYLAKPFAFTELVARVRALSRRFEGGSQDSDRLHCGEIVLHLGAHRAEYGGLLLHLTETEWNLLEYLMRHAGQLLTRQQIYEHVWGVNSDAKMTIVDVYVSYLRQKLRATSENIDPIETIRGVGYRFSAR